MRGVDVSVENENKTTEIQSEPQNAESKKYYYNGSHIQIIFAHNFSPLQLQIFVLPTPNKFSFILQIYKIISHNLSFIFNKFH